MLHNEFTVLIPLFFLLIINEGILRLGACKILCLAQDWYLHTFFVLDKGRNIQPHQSCLALQLQLETATILQHTVTKQ